MIGTSFIISIYCGGDCIYKKIFRVDLNINCIANVRVTIGREMKWVIENNTIYKSKYNDLRNFEECEKGKFFKTSS